MAGGLFSALSPSALLEGTLEMPLLAWARQAEITADRAGMLAIGNEDLVRRVLLTWSLKSPLLYRQINVQSWLDQQGSSDSEVAKLSELMTTSTPYIHRRLRLLSQFAATPDLERWQGVIRQAFEQSKKASPPPQKASSSPKKENNEVVRLKCTACATPMRVPSRVLEGKTQMSIRCPNPKCGKLTYMKRSIKKGPANAPTKKEIARNMTYDE